jgi:hypothetical protein
LQNLVDSTRPVKDQMDAAKLPAQARNAIERIGTIGGATRTPANTRPINQYATTILRIRNLNPTHAWQLLIAINPDLAQDKLMTTR